MNPDDGAFTGTTARLTATVVLSVDRPSIVKTLYVLTWLQTTPMCVVGSSVDALRRLLLSDVESMQKPGNQQRVQKAERKSPGVL